MAATITLLDNLSLGNIRGVVGYVTCDADYPATGYSFTLAQYSGSYISIGLLGGDAAFLHQILAGTNAQYLPYLDSADLKLKIFSSAAVGAHTHTSAAHAHSLLVKGGQAAAGTAALAWYATDILGKEAATDKTILAADTATKGGVLSATPGVTGSTTPSGGGFGMVAEHTDLTGVTVWYIVFGR